MSDKTSFYAPEIEKSLVSVLWHHPEFIDFVLLSIDPETHILDQTLRTVLEMVCVVFWEAGTTDWALVVQALRELDAIDECGGLPGLNDIYTDGGLSPKAGNIPSPPSKSTSGLLWYYQEQREQDPTKPVICFSGGRGKIVPNRRARSETDPSDIGETRIAGRRYRIAGWRDVLGNKVHPGGTELTWRCQAILSRKIRLI